MPPSACVRSSIDRYPFSETETEATGRVTPGTMPSVTLPPSSRTQANFDPRLASSSEIFFAPSRPPTSSSKPEAKNIVRPGFQPSPMSSSSASKRPMSDPLSSMAPRPQMNPSAMTPSNGGCVHLDSVPGSIRNDVFVAPKRQGASDGSAPYHR